MTCTECGTKLPPKSFGGKMVYSTEDIGKRLVALASQPVNKYDYMCVDCILDAGCVLPD